MSEINGDEAIAEGPDAEEPDAEELENMELVRTDITMDMSEARLNDLIYLLQRYLFFGEQYTPRECDIRVCMDLAVPSRLEGSGPLVAILLPNEVSGRSHEVIYEKVSFMHVFDTVIEYLEDHWMKQTFAQAHQDPAVLQKMWDWCCAPEGIFATIQAMPEAECASMATPKSQPGG